MFCVCSCFSFGLFACFKVIFFEFIEVIVYILCLQLCIALPLTVSLCHGLLNSSIPVNAPSARQSLPAGFSFPNQLAIARPAEAYGDLPRAVSTDELLPETPSCLVKDPQRRACFFFLWESQRTQVRSKCRLGAA